MEWRIPQRRGSWNTLLSRLKWRNFCIGNELQRGWTHQLKPCCSQPRHPECWLKQGKYHGNRMSPGLWDHLGWKSPLRSSSPSSTAKATANHVSKCHRREVFESRVLLSRLEKTNTLIMAFNNSLVFHLITINFFGCLPTWSLPVRSHLQIDL